MAAGALTELARDTGPGEPDAGAHPYSHRHCYHNERRRCSEPRLLMLLLLR
jgi:hypothetical protein